MDNGHVRYFGDHKATTTAAPGGTTGNAALLDAFTGHQGHTPEERATAAPLLLFRAVSRSGKVKGHVEFCGLGQARAFGPAQTSPRVARAKVTKVPEQRAKARDC
ncbi:hypothetical protein ACIPJM_09795 [Streptomyces halstedii]|uniref:hypothetical protein n=1 Tax=Streptomyces halstedii TaxID=1944 RepID=UPI003807DD5A